MCASPYIKDKYDLGILRADGTTKVGLMLAQKNGVPQYALFSKKKLADQYFTGVPDYGYQDPEEEVPIQQDDWRAGLGLEYADKNDPKRYHKSTMDMRFKGMGMAGTKATSVTKPDLATSLSNTNMESASAWTGGAQSADQAHGGTYSWKLTSTGAGDIDAYQDITPFNHKGGKFTVTCWGYGLNANRYCRLVLDDGVSETLGTTSESAAWAEMTATKVLSTSATRLRIILRFTADATGHSGYFDDVVISASPAVGVPTCVAEFNDALYMSFGVVLAKLNGTGTAFTIVTLFEAAITALEPFADDRLYIALGLSDQYWYMNTSEAFTESTAAVTNFKYFRTVHSATPVLWGSDAVNTIRSNTNPINGGAAWSAQTTVASSYHSITKLMTKSGALYIMKEDIPYYLNSAGAVQNDLAPELGSLATGTSNGKNAILWLNILYLPWGDQSLLENDAGVNTWRSPALFCTEASEYNGKVLAVCGDDQFLFAVLEGSTTVEILAGRLETIDGTTGWVWHCINSLTLTSCETAFVSSVYQKRLWILSTVAAEDLNYIPLPTGYADIANDANRSFLTGTTFETSWLHGNFNLTTKAFTELTLVMGHTYDAAKYFTVKYKKLGDSSWTTIGNYTGSATSMTQSRYIPADASSNNPKSTMFKLQFTAVTDSTTVTPILLNYLLKGVLYPGQRDIIACSIRCSNEIVLRDGTIDRGSHDNIVTVIDEARVATWPVTVYDIDGSTVTAKFLPVNPLWTVTRNEKGRVIESQYNLLLQKVTLS